jgi:alpha-glucoside transport system substrate-binding protein
MKFKKVFSILVLLAVLLTACQPAAVPAEESAPAAAEEAAPAAEEAPVVEEEAAPTKTLQILGPWLATEADAFEYVLDGFREQTGIEVEYEGSKETPTLAVTRVGAGSPPDIAMLPVSRGLTDLIAQNAVVPLTDLESDIKANYSPGWLARYTFDGVIYGIPNRANVQNLLWFNPTTLNGDAPTNWSEFIDHWM